MNYRLRPGGKVHAIVVITDQARSSLWIRGACREGWVGSGFKGTEDTVTCKRCLKAAKP